MKLLEQPMVIAFEKNFPEAILAVSTALYGGWITVPPNSLEYSQGYGVITALVPSWTLGVVFLVVGLTNLWGVLRRKGDLVRSTSRVLSVMWFMLAFLYAWSAVFAPGWILLLCLATLYAGVGSEYRTKSKWHDGTGRLGPDL